MTAPSTIALPGDFAVVPMCGQIGRLIEIGEILAGSKGYNYEHAFLYVGGPDNLILEAAPEGAQLHPYHYDDASVLWSTGRTSLALTDDQRALIPGIAVALQGTPYSAADYFAIAAHRLHVWTPGLKSYIGSTRHMICSQLVDYSRQLVGSHLFSDNRFPGYVMPSDLGGLILASLNAYQV